MRRLVWGAGIHGNFCSFRPLRIARRRAQAVAGPPRLRKNDVYSDLVGLGGVRFECRRTLMREASIRCQSQNSAIEAADVKFATTRLAPSENTHTLYEKAYLLQKLRDPVAKDAFKLA